MDLEKIGKRSGRDDHPDASAQLKFLLQSAQAWQQIDRLVKQELPANLHPYLQTACISEGCLVLLAANGMAASRAKMLAPGLLPRLQRHTGLIRDIKVKTVPKKSTNWSSVPPLWKVSVKVRKGCNTIRNWPPPCGIWSINDKNNYLLFGFLW